MARERESESERVLGMAWDAILANSLIRSDTNHIDF